MERLKKDVEKLRDGIEDFRKSVLHKTEETVISTSLSLSSVREVERIAQKRGTNTVEERFKVMPDYAYPNTRLNREELRQEMNKKSSYFHDLGRLQPLQQQCQSQDRVVGQLAVEILQCFGLPKTDSLIGETSAFCIAVCEEYAFKTDVMPPVANPMWLSRMRRACIFPVYHAYARLMIGVFGQQGSDSEANNEKNKDSFAGRVVVDLARLRPHCTYDITLPLRQSVHVYSRRQRGSIRFRFHLTWHSERQALLSYLPKTIPNWTEPNERVTVQCCDAKSFQNVARVVHGNHMPGRFTTKQIQATIREINFTRIHVLRYMRKREFRDTTQWKNPVISGFVFFAWMHCVYQNSVSFVPGHLVTFLLLHVWKNYAYYALDSPVQNGFLAPTFEEMLMALLRGGGSIKPLEMEMKDESSAKSALQDITTASPTNSLLDELSSSSSTVSLTKIAEAFRNGVKGKSLRYHLTVYHNAFRGTEAVDFLVDSGYASSREDAVAIGCRLANEMKLFEHVRRKHEFKDEGLYYVYQAVDSHEYAMTTHRPWGKPLFCMLGFLPEVELTEAEAHLEMPFSTGADHPRYTVKESLVIRSKESKRLLLQEQIEESTSADNLLDSKIQSQQLAEGIDHFFEENDENNEGGLGDEDATDEENENALVEFELLKKPPLQDIDVKIKGDKKITEVLAEARHKVHGVLLHLFNDRVYKIDAAKTRSLGSKTRSISSTKKRSWRKKLSQRSQKTPSNEESVSQIDVAARKDEYDKLLGIDKYSHGNPWIAKVGVIVQPIVEIALNWLCLFRALFNVFTWRDPMLSFWVSIIGPFLVVGLHFFPWRWVLGLLGVVVMGPQNWMLRIMRERKEGYEPFDPDKIIKKKRCKEEVDSAELPLFSMYAPDNRPVRNTDLDPANVRKVVVPSSPLMYQRFYDWPPENEYARVYAEDPPTSDLLEKCTATSMHVHDGSGTSENGVASPNRSGEVRGSHRMLLKSLQRIRRRRNKNETSSQTN